MNISVFGIGYVGCVSLGCLAADGHNIIGVDSNHSKVDLINSGKPTVIEKNIDEKILAGVSEKRIIAVEDFFYAVKETEISIICVGTPIGKDGKLDLSHVFKVAEQIGDALKFKNTFHIISVRSSIPPGTISLVESIISKRANKNIDEDFSVLANPEFLREGTAVNDYYNPPYTLIGGKSNLAKKKLAEVYKNVNGEIVFTDSVIAELIKFANNSFHALKVSFANEIGNICSGYNIDSSKFMEIFLKDTKLNISENYLKPGFAYGGSCLPKDLKALESMAEELNIKTPLISGISKSNETHIELAFHLVKSIKKKNVGIAGITFKEGTDDVRNSPYISLVKKLLDKKYSVKIFDPNIRLENVIGANKDFLFKELPIISDYLINSIDRLIEESDVIVLANSKLISTEQILKHNNKIFIDLVRIDEVMRSKDNYIGLSW
ncbi:unnamed protein product [Rotaria sp. Silwood1]|nr:unnamed protein product [Rotaria sp. Silwood1]